LASDKRYVSSMASSVTPVKVMYIKIPNKQTNTRDRKTIAMHSVHRDINEYYRLSDVSIMPM